jgi:RNA polymerase-binding transcription factor DksA
MATAKQPAAKQATQRPSKAAAGKPASAANAGRGSAQKRSAKTPQKAAAPRPSTTSTKATTSTMSTATKSASGAAEPAFELPKPKFNKDGLGYTKDFDVAFIREQYDALQAERVRLTGQALRLEAEAHQLVEEAEMGDVKFDDEGGEGDSTSVERERDLALSAQAREAIEEIDAALLRIGAGTYGYSLASGRPIPRERLEAIPWSSVLVEEKVGGIGRR